MRARLQMQALYNNQSKKEDLNRNHLGFYTEWGVLKEKLMKEILILDQVA